MNQLFDRGAVEFKDLAGRQASEFREACHSCYEKKPPLPSHLAAPPTMDGG